MKRSCCLILASAAAALSVSCDSPAEEPTSNIMDPQVSQAELLQPAPATPGSAPGCSQLSAQPPAVRGGITWSVYTQEQIDYSNCLDRARGRTAER